MTHGVAPLVRFFECALEIVETLFDEGLPVGAVLQSYLKRTEADAKALGARGIPVRLCKGIYREPRAIAWHDFSTVRANFIYNMEKFQRWIDMANDMGLTEKVYILAGVTPMKSIGMAKYMKSRVPGMEVPDGIEIGVGTRPLRHRRVTLGGKTVESAAQISDGVLGLDRAEVEMVHLHQSLQLFDGRRMVIDAQIQVAVVVAAVAAATASTRATRSGCPGGCVC